MYPSVVTQPTMKPRSPQEAIDAMLALLGPVATQRIALRDAAGRVLAEAIVTDRPSPAADVSAMDGYAVRMTDIRPNLQIPVACDAQIGQPPPPLPPMQAIRIVTGGRIPPGADTVIRREDTIEHDDRIELPDSLPPQLSRGANIRFKGENAAVGDAVASAGMQITAALAGALASVGCASPLVYRRVRVGVLVTGDEVLPVEASLSPYQLRDSNGPALTTLLAGASWMELVKHRRVGDDRAALRESVEELLSQCDALVLTGGVSMGNRDFVPTVLEEAGSRTVFHRVPQRPGKPMLGAIGPTGQAILGLPGNPVSVLITARRVGVAVLRHLAGMPAAEAPSSVVLENPDEKRVDLWWHRLVRLSASGQCELVPSRGSGDIIAAGQSDGFVEIPPNETGPGPWPLYRWRI